MVSCYSIDYKAKRLNISYSEAIYFLRCCRQLVVMIDLQYAFFAVFVYQCTLVSGCHLFCGSPWTSLDWRQIVGERRTSNHWCMFPALHCSFNFALSFYVISAAIGTIGQS